MKQCRLSVFMMVAFGMLNASALGDDIINPSRFTYQGELRMGGLPVSEECGFLFRLFDMPIGGAQIGPTNGPMNVTVEKGIFTVQLDFGVDPAFCGQRRWLEITVCCPTPCASLVPLTPRQELTPSPYAISLPALKNTVSADAGFPDSPNLIGGHHGNSIGAGSAGAVVVGGGAAGANNSASGSFPVVGGGSNNTASGARSTVSGGGANTASGAGATVAGGRQNDAMGIDNTVGGGFENNATGAGTATIGGGAFNTANAPNTAIGGGNSNAAGANGATVAGGSNNTASGVHSTVSGGDNNIASGDQSTVSGGNDNQAIALRATVGGGTLNMATMTAATVAGGSTNTASGIQATVSGGQQNTASENQATVCGGLFNTASGERSVVGGGLQNTAGGLDSVIPGGFDNETVGSLCFAAGRQAKANFTGMFVWADNRVVDFPSATEANFTPAELQFLARATGGVVFVSAINAAGDSTAGVQLAPGGGAWAALSDRNAKANVKPVNEREVLERLSKIPVSTWNYKSQDKSIRHIGPMAQDLYAAFGVGESEKMITTVDADGVALAAIQGLHQIVKEKNAKIKAMESRLEALEATIAAQPR